MVRQLGKHLAAMAAVLAAAGMAAAQPAAPVPAGQAEFRAGWMALAEPVSESLPESPAEQLQRAREAAIPHLEAAVAAAPEELAYQTSLTWAYLLAGKYQKALDTINRAIARERGDPLLYLLRGQAEAALAQLKPEEASSRIGPALVAFARAAELDPQNALPLLQAASVAVDVNSPEQAVSYLKQALSRQQCRLYRLPIPEDLGMGPAGHVKTWERLQYGFWAGLLARCRNVADFCLRTGKELEDKGELAGAEERYLWARSVASLVGRAEPRLFITVNTGIDLREDVFGHLAQVGKALGRKEAELWANEPGICEVGRQHLFGALQAYEEKLAKGEVGSVAEALELQGRLVSPVIAGVGF